MVYQIEQKQTPSRICVQQMDDMTKKNAAKCQGKQFICPSGKKKD
jgi:hypothetical protein